MSLGVEETLKKLAFGERGKSKVLEYSKTAYNRFHVNINEKLSAHDML